jgi:hypothetical protein
VAESFPKRHRTVPELDPESGSDRQSEEADAGTARTFATGAPEVNLLLHPDRAEAGRMR